MLQLLGEEEIPEAGLEEYFGDLYRIVCVSERTSGRDHESAPVRTTYIMDWEQLVHLLEGYDDFDQDIVEVARLRCDEALVLRGLGAATALARA